MADDSAQALDPALYERLGVFYLGRPWDVTRRQGLDRPLLYDSRDLLTHAVCIGMTGSGKTGLGIGLIEEAALDGVPVLVIDPKGDLGNLLLTFPDLAPAEFRPWVNEDDARRAGLSPEEFAAGQAELWRRGLERWGQSGERIARLRRAAEFAIYTPGSEAGLPVSVLASFAAPAPAVRVDADLLRERIATAASSVLSLLGIDADPIQSREHILLSNLLERRWAAGADTDLASLIRDIQRPPLDEIGVLRLEDFYPARDRETLALKLNSLLASPGFQGWFAGEPLDIGRLLYTADGGPRVAIFSIAHLSEPERMFFVSLLLNELVSWMRGRSGTTSLRALLYMDEIFGFMPPVAEPPSKKPLLTLMKQARAHGVGVVLATQNPVDLDYKGLSNAGTWFIGRLQTERDKVRILEGLEGVDGSAGFDRPTLESVLSRLDKRVFLLHNVHDDAPQLFETRWVMSYLRGPLTRDQIRRLMADRKGEPEPQESEAEVGEPVPGAVLGAGVGERPLVDSGVDEWILVSDGVDSPLLRPHLLGEARICFIDRKSKSELARRETLLVWPLESDRIEVDWSRAHELQTGDERLLRREPPRSARWVPVPAAAAEARSYTGWKKELVDSLYRSACLELLRSATLRMTSEPDETEREFRIRLGERAREQRDQEVEKLRQRHAKKTQVLEDRLRRARARLEKEKEQASSQKLQTAMSIGAVLLSVMTGRRGSRSDLSRAASALRGVGRTTEQAGDVDRAEDTVESLERQLSESNEELANAIERIGERLDPRSEELETIVVRPRKSDIDVRRVALLWMVAQRERSTQ